MVYIPSGGSQLTIDSGHTLLIKASLVDYNPITLINNGTIQADGAGIGVELAGAGNCSNTGAIEATDGATVNLGIYNGGTFANSGTILAQGMGSELILIGGQFSNSGSGTIEAMNGATVELQQGDYVNGLVTAGPNTTFSIGGGAFFDNTGTTPGSGSTIQPPLGGTLLLGGTISGGTVSDAGGTFLNPSGGILDGTPTGGITLFGTLLHDDGAETLLQGLINDPNGFTFDSNPSAGAGAGYSLLLSGNTELNGNNSTTTIADGNGGTIQFGTFFNGYSGVSQLTIDSGHTLLSRANVQSFQNQIITLVNNGTVQADGANNQFYLSLVDASSNAGTIAATNGAIVTLDNSAGGTFENSGILEAADGGILTFVSANLTNNGTIELQNGTIITDVALAVGDGTLTGSGTINGDVALDSDPSTLEFEIRSDTDFDSLLVDGNVFLAGDLEITLAPGAASLLNSGDTFEVLDANSLSGSFDNVADDQRLATSDGSGSFLVNYGTGADSDEIVLSDFQSVPEPACLSLLGVGVAGLLKRRQSAGRFATIDAST